MKTHVLTQPGKYVKIREKIKQMLEEKYLWPKNRNCYQNFGSQILKRHFIGANFRAYDQHILYKVDL